MSAQPSQHETTRLLIAEKSENSAHALDSVLRDAGIATQLSISDDLAHIAQMLAEGETDIALLTDQMDGLETLIPRIREHAPHTPIILLVDDKQQEAFSVAGALGLGATDVVPNNCPEQLALVVKRELENVAHRHSHVLLRRALNEAEKRCQLLLQGSDSAIAYVHEGMHIYANEQYLELFGYSDTDDILGTSIVDVLNEESATALKTHLKKLRQALASGNATAEAHFDFVGLLQSKDESSDAPAVGGRMSLKHAEYEGENCIQISVQLGTDETKVANTKEAPGVDELLELPGFLRAAESYFAGTNDHPYLLVAALDNFSELQETYGLVGAETVCRKVWLRLRKVTKDFPVTRLGNNLIAVAITGDCYDQVNERANEFCRAVNELIFEVQERTVRPSITIAGLEVDRGEDVSKILDIVHTQLHHEIASGATNVVAIVDKGADEADAGTANVILRQITEAIDKKMFVVLFQPVISLRGDSDEHYEVFLRMVNDKGEQIVPSRFLQTAIDNNVAGKIDRWVILQSIKMLSVHRAKGHATRLTINLTANSVMDSDFLQWLGVAIKAARLPSDAVIFQITEKDASTYLRQTREFVEGLRKMHCRASLSRFGLIENPFETLRHIPVDMVKVDGERIKQMESSEEKRDEVVESIKQLQELGKLTIVPMVENANVLSTLWQAGVNYIQGHYLQEPTTEMDYDFSTED